MGSRVPELGKSAACGHEDAGRTIRSSRPVRATLRMVASEPLANNVLKCQLKAMTASDYTVTFTNSEMAQLASIFPQGVRLYEARCRTGPRRFAGAWQRYSRPS